MNKMKRIGKLSAAVLLIVCVSGLLRFLLSPVTYGHWAIHDRRELSGKIDTLVIGDSLPMYAVQPSKLDDTLHCCSFNTCSASQWLEQTYFLLQDFVKTEDIKTVFWGLDYYNFSDTAQDVGIISNQIVYQRLQTPAIKIRFLKEFLALEDAWMWVFPERISRNDFANIPKNVKTKLSYEYLHYLPLSDGPYLLESGTYYYDKGYVRTDLKQDSYSEGKIDLTTVSESSLYWFKAILQLCKENKIEVFVFHTPVMSSRLKEIRNYELFSKTISSVTAAYGYKYRDFNFYSERDTLMDDVGFVNAAHLNYTGSNIFMEWLFQWLHT